MKGITTTFAMMYPVLIQVISCTVAPRVAHHVRERDADDRRVDGPHQRPKRDRDRDEPLVRARPRRYAAAEPQTAREPQWPSSKRDRYRHGRGRDRRREVLAGTSGFPEGARSLASRSVLDIDSANVRGQLKRSLDLRSLLRFTSAKRVSRRHCDPACSRRFSTMQVAGIPCGRHLAWTSHIAPAGTA